MKITDPRTLARIKKHIKLSRKIRKQLEREGVSFEDPDKLGVEILKRIRWRRIDKELKKSFKDKTEILKCYRMTICICLL